MGGTTTAFPLQRRISGLHVCHSRPLVGHGHNSSGRHSPLSDVDDDELVRIVGTGSKDALLDHQSAKEAPQIPSGGIGGIKHCE